MTQAVDRAVKERWLTASDGRKIKAELAAPLALRPFGRKPVAVLEMD